MYKPLVHEFHAHVDAWLIEEDTEKVDDVGRVAFVHDLQLSEDLLPNGRLGIDENFFFGHAPVGRDVAYFCDNSTVPGA